MKKLILIGLLICSIATFAIAGPVQRAHLLYISQQPVFDLFANWQTTNQTLTNTQVLSGSGEGVQRGAEVVTDSGAGSVKVVSGLNEITGSGTWDETGVREQSGLTKALGKAVFATLTHNTAAASLFGVNTAAGIVRANGMEIEFSAADALTVTADDASASHVSVGAVVDSTTYQLLGLMGGCNASGIIFKTGDTIGDFTRGIQWFGQGGAFTTWTRLWTACTDNTATLYAYRQVLEASAVNYDNISIPTEILNVDTMFQPRFLDTFTGTNGDSLRDTHHPDVVNSVSSPGVTAWESGADTWDIQGNQARNTPGMDADLTANNRTTTDDVARTEADNISDWTNDGMATFESVTEGGELNGSFSLHLVANSDGDHAYKTITTVVGLPYKVAIIYKRNALTDASVLRIGSSALSETDAAIGLGQDWETKSGIFIATSVTTYFTIKENGTNDDAEIWVDALLAEPITLNELISSDDLGIDEGIFDLNGTIPAALDGQVGIVTHLDSSSSPANGVFAYYDRSRTRAMLFKLVGGAGTSLISVSAITYAAGAQLRVIAYNVAGGDMEVRLFYNKAAIGTKQTLDAVTDAAIIGNTRHGIISVDSDNRVDNFAAHRRTDANWDVEILRATGGVY